MSEAAIELLVALRKYIEESEERMAKMNNQIKLLTVIDESILESRAQIEAAKRTLRR